MRCFTTFCALLAAAAPSWGSAEVLYSTSYEDPDYSQGPLSGQDGWVNSFDIDPVVTTNFAQSGSQALEVRKTPADNPFGLTFRSGPYSTTAQKVSVQHSVYLAGSSGWEGTFVSPLALIGDNGGENVFVGQLAIEDGALAVLGLSELAPNFSVPVETNRWINLEIVLDFPTQTLEGFVDGVSIGAGQFANPATELVQVEIFHIIDTFNPFYVDDLSITAIPEPTSASILAFAAFGVMCRRRF